MGSVMQKELHTKLSALACMHEVTTRAVNSHSSFQLSSVAIISFTATTYCAISASHTNRCQSRRDVLLHLDIFSQRSKDVVVKIWFDRWLASSLRSPFTESRQLASNFLTTIVYFWASLVKSNPSSISPALNTHFAP